jgi:hypothetical protein
MTMAKKDKGLAVPASAPGMDDDYETQGHLRTLMDAEHIKRDPVKMKKVHKLAGRHKKAITSIQDLKDTFNEKFGPQGSAEEMGE